LNLFSNIPSFSGANYAILHLGLLIGDGKITEDNILDQTTHKKPFIFIFGLRQQEFEKLEALAGHSFIPRWECPITGDVATKPTMKLIVCNIIF
jgi:hypothetical protein